MCTAKYRLGLSLGESLINDADNTETEIKQQRLKSSSEFSILRKDNLFFFQVFLMFEAGREKTRKIQSKQSNKLYSHLQKTKLQQSLKSSAEFAVQVFSFTKTQARPEHNK